LEMTIVPFFPMKYDAFECIYFNQIIDYQILIINATVFAKKIDKCKCYVGG
jgi:hypothetical protein